MPEDVDQLLEDLTNAYGPTGFEGPVRAIMRRELTPIADEIETDALGSLISTLRGSSQAPRVMLAAHMDELGLMVKRVTDEGFLKFQPLGGWLDQALINQRWLILTRDGVVPAVTGIKTIHVMSVEARGKLFKREDMFLDAGATSREDAEGRLGVRPGDPVVPDSRFAPMSGGGRLLAKAWDDRIGLAVMIGVMRALKADGAHPNTVVGVATVQEEVGLRGAQTSSYRVAPDVGISLESGVAGDFPGITPDEVTTIGDKHRGRRRAILQWFAALAMMPVSRTPRSWRRDVILAVGRKTASRVDRRPAWLYFDLGEYALEQQQAKQRDRKSVVAAPQASPAEDVATARSA